MFVSRSPVAWASPSKLRRIDGCRQWELGVVFVRLVFRNGCGSKVMVPFWV